MSHSAEPLSPGELEALAVTAAELWDHADPDEAAEYLSARQVELLKRARLLYSPELDGPESFYEDAVAYWRRVNGTDPITGKAVQP